MKILITKYKKEYFYGDCHLEEWGHYFPLIGARLKVQILNIFWVTYFSFEYKKQLFIITFRIVAVVVRLAQCFDLRLKLTEKKQIINYA